MRTKQYLAAVRPGPDGVLVLSTMLYADEVVPVDELEGLPGPDDARPRSAIASCRWPSALVESLTAESFEPEKFHDTYRQQVLALIDAKAAGQTVTPPAAAADAGARVVDLMAALEASVQAAKERRAGGESKPAPASAPARGATARDAPPAAPAWKRRRRRVAAARHRRHRARPRGRAEAVEKPTRGGRRKSA